MFGRAVVISPRASGRAGAVEGAALRGALAGAALLSALALTAAAVRAVPWLLDRDVPLRVALPFVRAVASVALEAAILVGWPIGAALAVFASVERGEARVLQLLGERPSRTALRLAPVGMLFAAALACASLAGGRDASEPGRVLSELVAQGKRACASSSARAVDVPMVGATWLCADSPRLAAAPASLGAIVTAREVGVSPDARAVTFDDAWLALRSGTRVHVGRAVFHLPPFVRASALAPAWRALLLAASGLASSIAAALYVLLLAGARDSTWRLHAFLLGAAGPVAAIAVLHALERADAPAIRYLSLPLAAIAAPSLALAVMWRLPRATTAASK